MSTEQVTPFGIDRARELLRQAVDTQGRGFVYNPQGDRAVCYNRPMPVGFPLKVWQPVTRIYLTVPLKEGDSRTLTGCIAGTVFSLAGFTHHLTDDHIMSQVVEIRWTDDGEDEYFDNDVNKYLTIAQGQQDSGRTWGEAYDAAEKWWSRVGDWRGGRRGVAT